MRGLPTWNTCSQTLKHSTSASMALRIPSCVLYFSPTKIAIISLMIVSDMIEIFTWNTNATSIKFDNCGNKCEKDLRIKHNKYTISLSKHRIGTIFEGFLSSQSGISPVSDHRTHAFHHPNVQLHYRDSIGLPFTLKTRSLYNFRKFGKQRNT